MFPHDGLVAKGDELQRVGRAVAARRGALGMTRQELADAAGVDLKTVYNLESGTRWPIARTRVAISRALRWEGDALAGMADGSVPPDPAVPETRPRGFPRSTKEMREAMADRIDEFKGLADAAKAEHPGRRLTGAMVFHPGIDMPEAPRADAIRHWDEAALKHAEDRLPYIVAGVVTLNEQAAALRRNDSAIGLNRTCIAGHGGHVTGPQRSVHPMTKVLPGMH